MKIMSESRQHWGWGYFLGRAPIPYCGAGVKDPVCYGTSDEDSIKLIALTPV